MSARPISEDELHGYADGRLDAGRREAVEAWLAEHPEQLAQCEAWRSQNRLLHQAFDPVLAEPVPARLAQAAEPRRRAPLRWAAALAWLALGGVIGFVLRGYGEAPLGRTAPGANLARQAAIAHAIYSPEVRHPVEVGADQEQHLVTWLSKRLGAPVKAPRLAEAGYELVGGRLLPSERGPVAQFMYQDARGQRLTLYVRNDAAENRETAFRFAQEGKVSVFYWLDGRLGYALSGEIERPALLALANVVYRQLNP